MCHTHRVQTTRRQMLPWRWDGLTETPSGHVQRYSFNYVHCCTFPNIPIMLQILPIFNKRPQIIKMYQARFLKNNTINRNITAMSVRNNVQSTSHYSKIFDLSLIFAIYQNQDSCVIIYIIISLFITNPLFRLQLWKVLFRCNASQICVIWCFSVRRRRERRKNVGGL